MLILTLTHTEVTTIMSTVYTTLDYECRHENKGIGLILVPRKWGVYELDQRSYMISTVWIYIQYTQNAHPHTHREVITTMFTVYITLDYECRHENKGTDLVLVPKKCGVYELDHDMYSTDLH